MPMTVYQVQYDLQDPGQDYDDLHDAISGLGSECHILESAWLVDTKGPASDIRDDLKEHVDYNDRLFVTKLDGGWATTFSGDCTDWLHEHV